MKCVIPGGHLKVFGKAIHSLSRIGDELWFDPLDKGLALRAVNTARSAYACVFFSSFFFHSYHKVFVREEGLEHVPLQLNFKFPIKSVLHIFRSLSTLERNVEKCNIYIHFGSCHMVLKLFYKKGLKKTYNLAYEDCEPIEAVYSKSLSPNVLRIQSRALSDIIIHFPMCQEEVTITSTPHKIILKSYSEGDPGLSKLMHTEIHLGPDEFNEFHIGTNPCDITFCLKEVRGFLSFAEATSAIITIHFSKPGEATPVVHKTKGTKKMSKENKSYKSNKEPALTTSPVLVTKTSAGNSDQHIRREPISSTSYNKFCSLFFGAVSSEQQDKPHQLFYSLATASEDEDEGLSQTF
ncbi:cell cycle checkpoint control protein RAD9B isoform X2 [Dendropsophus ebraccatus]|uniref:cell cycle checkpoint control protein RAD9B isoform X2 n=1 Tax=Dendropsophus ebraccatus TaxID=150705 RepID=UPI003831CF8C